MARKRALPEDIVAKLGQAEAVHGQGMSMTEAVRQVGMSQHTVLMLAKARWQDEPGSAQAPQGA